MTENSEFDEDAETPPPQAPERMPDPKEADLDGLIAAQARQGTRLTDLENDVRQLREEVRMPSESMKKLFFYVSAWVNEAGERWFKKPSSGKGTKPPETKTKPPR